MENTPGESLVNEAIRLLGSSPKWMPGEKEGREVASRHNVRIQFAL